MHLRARLAVLLLLAFLVVRSDPAPGSTAVAPSPSQSPSAQTGALGATPRPSATPVRPTAPTLTPLPLATPSTATNVPPETPPCPGRAPAAHRLGPGEAHETSNWAGFVVFAPSAPFTCVEGRWTEPKVVCSTPTWQAASFWVGLDGWNEEHLEQIGTEVQCFHGRAEHFAWHEVLPRQTNSIRASLAVRAGDRIWARVLFTGGAYTMTLANLTMHRSLTIREGNKGAPRASAEWIAESPSSGCPARCRILLLPNFKRITFSGTFATAAGVRSSIDERGWVHDRVDAATSTGSTRLAVSAWAADGRSSTVTWLRR
jgi:hypothetical protein